MATQTQNPAYRVTSHNKEPAPPIMAGRVLCWFLFGHRLYVKLGFQAVDSNIAREALLMLFTVFFDEENAFLERVVKTAYSSSDSMKLM